MSGQVSGKVIAARFLMQGEDVWVTQIFIGNQQEVNDFLAKNQPNREKFRNFRIEPMLAQSYLFYTNEDPLPSQTNMTLGGGSQPIKWNPQPGLFDRLVISYETKIEKKVT